MTMGPTVRAIDVGFGNTKFVTASTAGKVDCSHFPSLAFYSLSDKPGDVIGGRRRTVCIPVDGLYYEVGHDVELAADRFRSRQLHDGYIETAEYRALMAGALSYMKLDRVDLLVLGLPVSHYLAKKGVLEKSMRGTFDVGKKRNVNVGRVLVVPQPQGALFEFAMRDRVKVRTEGRCLVVDVGARTFDWLVTQNFKVLGRMSNSVTRGVSDILSAIADKLGAELKEEFRDLEAIDQALRGRKPLRIYQKEFDLKRFEPMVHKVAEQAVLAMVQAMDGTHGVEHILLVGGGAGLFKRALRKHFPRHDIAEVADPLYANVRGFQLFGERYVNEHRDLFEGASTAQPEAAVTT
jgi:plasmid segregation protein ParM